MCHEVRSVGEGLTEQKLVISSGSPSGSIRYRADNSHAFSVGVTHFGAISSSQDEASVSHVTGLSQYGVKNSTYNANDVSGVGKTPPITLPEFLPSN